MSSQRLSAYARILLASDKGRGVTLTALEVANMAAIDDAVYSVGGQDLRNAGYEECQQSGEWKKLRRQGVTDE